jgi:hypothetical protein
MEQDRQGKLGNSAGTNRDESGGQTSETDYGLRLTGAALYNFASSVIRFSSRR